MVKAVDDNYEFVKPFLKGLTDHKFPKRPFSDCKTIRRDKKMCSA